MTDDIPGREPAPVPGGFADFLDRAKTAYERAETTGRFDPLADYCADDLVVLRPDHEPIVGKAVWAAIFDEALASNPDIEATWTSQETAVHDTVAMDRGICEETVVAADGDRRASRFNYLWLFERAGDSWAFTHKMWNRIE